MLRSSDSPGKRAPRVGLCTFTRLATGVWLILAGIGIPWSWPVLGDEIRLVGCSVVRIPMEGFGPFALLSDRTLVVSDEDENGDTRWHRIDAHAWDWEPIAGLDRLFRGQKGRAAPRLVSASPDGKWLLIEGDSGGKPVWMAARVEGSGSLTWPRRDWSGYPLLVYPDNGSWLPDSSGWLEWYEFGPRELVIHRLKNGSSETLPWQLPQDRFVAGLLPGDRVLLAKLLDSTDGGAGAILDMRSLSSGRTLHVSRVSLPIRAESTVYAVAVSADGRVAWLSGEPTRPGFAYNTEEYSVWVSGPAGEGLRRICTLVHNSAMPPGTEAPWGLMWLPGGSSVGITWRGSIWVFPVPSAVTGMRGDVRAVARSSMGRSAGGLAKASVEHSALSVRR